VQQLIDGNFQKASKLYEHCQRFKTPDYFKKLCDALEHSRNFPALRILDPDRKTKLEPDSVGIPPLERTHIRTFDVASLLHVNTGIRRNWTILKDALQVKGGEWAQAVRMCRTQPLLNVIKFLLDTWSDRVGWDKSTVGNVCDSFDSHFPRNPRFLGRDGTFHTEKTFADKYKYSYPILAKILLCYKEVSRETVISKTASLDGHRTIIIQLHSIHEVLANFDSLCTESNMNESLINALYAKGVIDTRFKKRLVRS
jgi:hypothetical protein